MAGELVTGLGGVLCVVFASFTEYVSANMQGATKQNNKPAPCILALTYSVKLAKTTHKTPPKPVTNSPAIYNPTL
jgi:hypothetical protein